MLDIGVPPLSSAIYAESERPYPEGTDGILIRPLWSTQAE
jgi:hypothetical protein